MRILFGAPDRDLLRCYKQLLSESLGDTVTAFDGTQIMSLPDLDRFDIAVIDSGIPRVGYTVLTEKLRADNIPVIVLINGELTSDLITSGTPANAYLTYPFSPAELTDEIRNVSEKAASDEIINVADIVIDVSGFRIKGGAALTAREIDIVDALAKECSLAGNDRSGINSINIKLAASGCKARIKYRPGEGFRVVTDNE